MNSENLKTFLLLSKLKNFTQTAEQLFVAQSTVTNRIAELEREVGKRLFIRDSKNLSLTHEGGIFLDYVKRILDLEEECLNEVHAGGAERVRIGFPNAVYESAWEKKILSAVREGVPVSFKVVLGHANDMLQMLQDKLLDVVFAFQPFQKQGYECESYQKDELVLLVRPDKNAYPEGIHRDELGKIPYIMCNFALQELGAFIVELFPPHSRFLLELDNSSKILPYLLEGVGYSFLPRALVQDYIADGRLTVVPLLDCPSPRIESYCIYRTGSAGRELLVKYGFLEQETQSD